MGPLVVVLFGVQELEDGVEVAPDLVQGGVLLGHVRPPPSTNGRFDRPLDHHRGVDREVECSADVGLELRCIRGGPSYPFEGADEGSRRASEHSPRPAGIANPLSGIIDG